LHDKFLTQVLSFEQMRRQNEISSEMGRLMLQRWAMLGDCCPDCGVRPTVCFEFF
jgi:uncharacterized Zn finger protein (UPF0148 family)